MQLFAHTSPVYVPLNGKAVFDVEAARELLEQLEEARTTIGQKGKFSTDGSRDKILVPYTQAMNLLRDKINARGAQP